MLRCTYTYYMPAVARFLEQIEKNTLKLKNVYDITRGHNQQY